MTRHYDQQMRSVSTAPSRAVESVSPVASGRAEAPVERLLRLQRTAGNRATQALIQRSLAGADRTRNPDPAGPQVEDEEDVTRDCSVSTGPAYAVTGSVPVTTSGGRKRAPFSFAATFNTASWWQIWSSADPACCEVRQYIKWDKAYQDEKGGPPHAGFPSTATYGTWFEDRDNADKRYGHRSGTHSDPIAGGGDEYTTGGARDQAHGDHYNGRDTPTGALSRTGTWDFKLEVIDTCNGNAVKATSSVITVNW
jgi:hypothetical protein